MAALVAPKPPMDVRCERCKAQYVVDDGLVDETGLAVRCSKCGHTFRVKRPPRGWALRKPSGEVHPLVDASMLQTWIVEGRANRADEISRDGGPWVRAGDLNEFEPFFAVVEQARRAVAPPKPPQSPASSEPQSAQPAPDDEPVMGGPIAEPSETWGVPAPATGASDEPAWAAGRPRAPVESRAAAPTQEPRRRGSRLPWVLAILVVLAGGVGAAYLLKPEWFDLDRLLGTGASTRVAQLAPPSAPAPTPVPERTPAPASAPSPAPTPVPAPGQPAETSPGPAQAVTSPAPGAPPETAGATPAPAPAPQAAPPSPAAPSPPPSTAPTPHAESPQPSGAPGAGAPRAAVPGQDAVAAAPRPPPTADDDGAAPSADAVDSTPAGERGGRPQLRGAKALVAEGRRLRERGKSEAALNVYGQAVQLDGKNADALAGRGLCYLDLSRYAPAEESFKAALQAKPEHGVALMGLAETYRYEGRRADAVTYYRKYLAAHPHGEDAAAARNAISALEE